MRDEVEGKGDSEAVDLGPKRGRDAEGVSGYEVATVDELEELPIENPGGRFVWRPIRRQFGISAFGTNAYTADAGQRVVEEHHEKDGHEEMYVVLRGRATFTLGDDEVDAPLSTPGPGRNAAPSPPRTTRRSWRSARSRASSSSRRRGRTSSPPSRTPRRARSRRDAS
jgi:hypothetical protein